jgi:uncharacterized protein YdeI (YjbR/CyaY-like superfamily)
VKSYRDVDAYIADSTQWPAELAAVRTILLECGLTEEIKWGKPCYGHDGHNIVIVQEMKQFLALMFFKGALLGDAGGALEEQGPNSRLARRIRLTSVDEVRRRANTIRDCVQAAIALGDVDVEAVPPPELALVEELRRRLEGDPTLRAAFEALTAGRQREYNLYFSGAKQAKTREARVEKYVPKILQGKGLRDR